MMRKKDGQMQIIIMDIGALVPENHLLRKIEQHIEFNFIYEKAAPYYSAFGRPSVDPVCMIKMLLAGYLYGTKSERRLYDVCQQILFWTLPSTCKYTQKEAHTTTRKASSCTLNLEKVCPPTDE